jgi:branched-chain amino acid transport system substrate-binding protein
MLFSQVRTSPGEATIHESVRRASGVIGVSLALCFASCGRAGLAEPPIRLGLIAYVTTDRGAAFGQSTIAAAQTSVEQVNAAGGLLVEGRHRPVELIVQEQIASPEAALAAAFDLINVKQVVAFVGPHWTREALAVAEIAERSGVPMITTGSTDSRTTQGKRYVFRVQFVDELQGATLAQIAVHEIGARRVAALYDASDPYAESLCTIVARELKKNGAELAVVETYTPDAKQDLTEQLRRIRAANPGALLLPNLTEDAIAQARQARRLGIGATVLGSDMWRTEIVGPELDGAFFTKQSPLDPQRQAVLAAALARAGHGTVSDEAAATYDAFELLFQAIRHAGDATPRAIRDGLVQIGPYEGVTGSIDYIEGGSPNRTVVVLQVRKGRAVPVSVEK